MDKALNELEACLQKLLEEHRLMLDLIRQKQRAMRSAKPDDVHQCCWLENVCIQRIGDVEKQRQETLGKLTAAWAPEAKQPLTIGQIADYTTEPRRGRLLVLKAQLTEMMTSVKRENDVAKVATESLLKHVQGVIQQVAAAMSTKTYGRRGTVGASSGVLASSFSVTG